MAAVEKLESTTDCNKCGEQIGFVRSHKTGKYYPVNITMINGEQWAKRDDFHSNSCKPKLPEINFKPLDNVEEAVSTPEKEEVVETPSVIQQAETILQDAQLPVGDSQYSQQLNEINQKIADFEKKILTWETENIKPIDYKLGELVIESDKLNEKQQALYQVYLDQKKKIDEEAQEIHEQKYQLGKEKQQAKMDLVKMQQELNNLKNLHALTLKQLATEKKLDELIGRLDMLLEGYESWNLASEFQKQDVLFSVAAFDQGLNGILNANEMGLGKTKEAADTEFILRSLFQEKYGRPPLSLWLTKKSLVKSSMNEIRKWNPDRMIIPITGPAEQRKYLVELAVGNNAMVITNYDALGTTPELMNIEWDIIFIDEVHKLKGGANSSPTQLWVNAKEVCSRAKFMYFLSGSPIINHPKEMWAYLHIFKPQVFPNVRQFEREFCFGYPEVKVDFEKLINAMAQQTIRRRKDEVALELPDLTREFRYVEMSPKQQEVYDKMRQEFFLWLDDQHEKSLTATAIIAQLTRLRQIALWPAGIVIKNPIDKSEHRLNVEESGKIDEAMELIEQILAQGEQVVVFSSQFNEPLKEIQRRVVKLGRICEIISGETINKVSQFEIDFQQQKIDVLAINMMTGSEGLNLQKNPDFWPGGANEAIFLDLWWAPAANEQGEARIHRKGQTHAVTVHIIQAEDSVDRFIAEILERKSDMVQGIMEDKSLRKGSDWKQILSKLI